MDADGDGASNYEELIAGTDPQSKDQVFKATFNGDAGSTSGNLTWTSTAGKQYRILVSDTLGSPFHLYTTITSAGKCCCCNALSSARDRWPGRPWVGMMHATLDSNRYSLATGSGPRLRALKGAADDNRTHSLINSSHGAEGIRKIYSGAAMYSCDYSVS